MAGLELRNCAEKIEERLSYLAVFLCCHMIRWTQRIYLESMLFFKQNLRHEQKGQNFNSTGILEISEIALEELVQNTLIHRDYTQNSPVRMMIFDNRIEIISPGCLPNNLTVEKIKLGYAVVRNNLLASFSSRLLKYRVFGSGIIRAVENQPGIEFINDEDGNQFNVCNGKLNMSP